MNSGLIAVLLAGAIPASGDVVHQVPVEHDGTRLHATYHGRILVRHKQLGAISAPGRHSVRRCVWTATVSVQRTLARPDGSASSPRPIDSDLILTGSRPGDCMAVRQGIARDLAAQRPAVERHVAAVAQRDAVAMRSDLRAMTRQPTE